MTEGKGLFRQGKSGSEGRTYMDMFVRFEAPATLIDTEQIMYTRHLTSWQMQEFYESGKVRASGMFADARGGFFVLDVDCSEELFDMLAPMADYMRIETHPLVSAEKLQEFFDREATPGAPDA
jgi:hypothetical protein